MNDNEALLKDIRGYLSLVTRMGAQCTATDLLERAEQRIAALDEKLTNVSEELQGLYDNDGRM